jgi:glycosyltransferase involved in cell wall biosynthesis
LIPLVSVVIPTYRRPVLVKRAAQSALAQTLHQIEVIVVIDGPDPEVRESLADITDARLRVIEKPVNEGCTAARMTGVHAAKAEWIAHLDDDDEWMSHKLEAQLKVAIQSQHRLPIVSCCVQVRFPDLVQILPRRIPTAQEHPSEYLFVRRNPSYGDGLIQASTLLVSKELVLQVPYTSDVHEDWGWILAATTHEGVGLEFLPEALSVWNLDANRFSMSRNFKWKQSLIWIRNNRHLVTPRAYSSFLLSEVGSRAAGDRAWNQFLPLLQEAIRFGKPRLMDYWLFLGMWLIPSNLRGWLRSLLGKKQASISPVL